ncbi:methyltransferase domain-containing protein [Candidatus Saccharibacteria bacterium]|nr:methyltransferase domain-containing protein [Candidatus Saccharibacteria bacterium]MBI3338269.1 methyltransferase domain-containing protein [Candidatus Saccharibacteria bacterium]
MNQAFCILGRQPALGIAELESLFGGDNIQPIGEHGALLNIEPAQIDFTRLGGTVKFCKLLTILDTVNWRHVEKFLAETTPQHLDYMPEGKMRLGLSVYGFSMRPQQIAATGLTLKKVIRASGRSVRVIPNVETALSSAQVLHNQLTGPLGWELIFVKHGSKTLIAQSIAVQDIESYTLRDRGRPKRDAKVGMLPPKLAQIIINLAVGLIEPVDPACSPKTTHDSTILDPFCGTGVILQEALIMGYRAYGTDIDRRMFEYSQTNLEWLMDKLQPTQKEFRVSIGDATQNEWVKPIDTVACETYLGRPFSAQPTADVLSGVIHDVNTIIKKFLKNLARQLSPGTRLCIAVPAWNTEKNFKHLPVLELIEELGYTRTSFVHVSNADLVYHRPDQVVARELIVLIRK